MIYNMLGLISATELNEKEMLLSFEIPDNCFYDFTSQDGNCVVSVKLNPGETDPSTTFVNNSETIALTSTVFNTNFLQFEKSGNIIKKPVIRVEY